MPALSPGHIRRRASVAMVVRTRRTDPPLLRRDMRAGGDSHRRAVVLPPPRQRPGGLRPHGRGIAHGHPRNIPHLQLGYRRIPRRSALARGRTIAVAQTPHVENSPARRTLRPGIPEPRATCHIPPAGAMAGGCRSSAPPKSGSRTHSRSFHRRVGRGRPGDFRQPPRPCRGYHLRQLHQRPHP